MRALKLTFALAGMLASVQYVAVYYNFLEFNDFVQHQARQTRSKGQFQSALVAKAKEYSLPLTDMDINITTTGDVLRVAVDYRMPLNLLLYSPELKFRAIGSGLMRQ